jgi:hypothetical protein
MVRGEYVKGHFLENKELQTNFLNFLRNMKPQDMEKNKNKNIS